MEGLMAIYTWLVTNLQDIISVIAHICLAGSIIVKLTPTLKDDNYWKAFIKFVGKYIALDKYGPSA